LSGLSEPNGNTIEVTYPSSGPTANPYAYPQQINYGANATAGYTHIFHVKFGYEARPDTVLGYRGGFAGRMDQRRISITILVDGVSTEASQTRKYTFTYLQDPDSGVSLLRTVAAAPAGSGTTAPPVTTFTYQQGSHALATAAPLNFDH